MWWPLEAVYLLFWNSLLDLVFFIIIDSFAKITLGSDTRSRRDKKLIWLGESAVLGVVCIVIYLCDHIPIVLTTLTIVTFLCTQLGLQLDIRNWWLSLQTRWEEHQQHQDSVRRLKEQQENTRYQPNLNPHARLTSHLPARFQYRQPAARNIPPTQNLAPHVQNTAVSSTPSFWPKNFSRLNLINRFKKTDSIDHTEDKRSPLSKQEYSFIKPQQKQTPYISHKVQTNADPSIGQINEDGAKASWMADGLSRRPLRTSNKILPKYSSDGRSLRNKFMSAFGFSEQTNKPVGIRNDGQNLCFMNSMIHCMARTPNFVNVLSMETSRDSECSVAESVLLKTCVDILHRCKTNMSDSGAVIDTTSLRQAASSLPNSIVAMPTEHQAQQDAAEFFMWLMDSLHNLINKNRMAFHNGPNQKSNERLKTLKFIYGDLNPCKIEELKDACKQEIDAAHGLQNDSYAEPVQRLSDLEWLSYKEKNDSVMDNTFTGQLVIGYHCLMDNRVAVNMQTFNMLPVPIVEPREMSGLVLLTDCFSKFCKCEQLTGQDGLNHDAWCPAAEAQFKYNTPKQNGRNTVLSSADSGIQSPIIPNNLMSPIQGVSSEGLNDSGCHENVFKTSTPIQDENTRQHFVPRHQVIDAQRRCLLRQLPDCLVIQLMRFSYNPFTRLSAKVKAPVVIPIKELDLTQILFDTVTNREDLSAQTRSNKYDLYGVCVHLGADNTSFGHYICYCLDDKDNKWYRFDDEIVTEVNMEYELTTREVRENAYILFYKQAPSGQ